MPNHAHHAPQTHIDFSDLALAIAIDTSCQPAFVGFCNMPLFCCSQPDRFRLQTMWRSDASDADMQTPNYLLHRPNPHLRSDEAQSPSFMIPHERLGRDGLGPSKIRVISGTFARFGTSGLKCTPCIPLGFLKNSWNDWRSHLDPTLSLLIRTSRSDPAKKKTVSGRELAKCTTLLCYKLQYIF